MTFIQQVADTAEWTHTAGSDQDASERVNGDGGLTGPSAPGLLAHGRRLALLNRIVEAEILPRLALARGGVANGDSKPASDQLTTADDTAELVKRLLGREESSAWLFIEILEVRGIVPANLYLGVVTAAARRLGELWEDDRCNFAEVTIGLGRLQQIVRALSPAFQQDAPPALAHADRILLLPAPDEQHTMGLVILGEFFQRDGWQVAGGPVSVGYDGPSLVRDDWIDIAGFSLASSSHVEALTTMIRGVRRASRNRHLGIMVGGPLFLQRPELVAQVGADTTAPDAPTAVRRARTFLSMRAAIR